jgi:hypothetical protein
MEKAPFHQYKINLSFGMNKNMDIRFIYPQNEEENPELNYPNSSLVVKLKSNTMPHNLVEALLKKAENMIKKLTTE